jgi:hypothetical protein
MVEVVQGGEALVDDAARATATGVDHKGDTAGVVLGSRVVKPLGGRHGGEEAHRGSRRASRACRVFRHQFRR